MKQEFVAGIYNYCDRWCERCTFTSRCRNFEGNGKLKPEELDIHNKAFWKHISSQFEKALVLLHKMAEERGLDLNNISEEDTIAYEQRRALIEEATKSHILIRLCKQYEQTVMPFFNTQISGELVEKTRELVSQLHMGIKATEDVVHTMAGLGDCEDVIRWYLFFIDAKLQRALQGKPEVSAWHDDNGFPNDSDGSAKMGIIAIERSIGAWIKMYELLPSSEDVSLKALSLLSQLKHKAIEEFPQAMNFKRPGFDE